MVTIVTGKVNSGKTSYLLEQYKKNGRGDGFISRKIMSGSNVVGYCSVRLSTHAEKMWMIHSDFYAGEFIHEGRIGPYYLSLDGLAEMERLVDQMIDKRVSPIYLDEIGCLELTGKGYDSIIKKLVHASLDTFIAVREDLVPSVVEHYKFADYSIVKVKP